MESTSQSQALDDQVASDLSFSSSLRTQLRSSFGLPSTQLKHVLEVLAQKEQSLAEDLLHHKTEKRRNEMEMNRHQAAIIALENQQRGLASYRHAYHSLMSPARRLPKELLEEIFFHFCDEIEVYQGEIYCAALKLAAVCGAWRDIVLSSSRVWTRIKVSIPDELVPDMLRSMEELINLALAHSRDAPLYLDLIYLYHSDGAEPDGFDVVASIMKTFARHSYHWCHVVLDLPDTLFNEMRHFMQGCVMLKSLTVYECLPTDTFKVASELRHLNLLENDFAQAFLAFPWDQILTLYIDSARSPLSEIVACVEACTSLQKLYLKACGSDPLREAGDKTHSIRSLQILDLSCSHALEKVFSSFTLPRLIELSLASGYANWTWSDEHERLAKGFLSRTSCTITSLTLSGMLITDRHLISLLLLMPSVETLSVKKRSSSEITLMDITDLLITSLCISHSSFSEFVSTPFKPLLPKLQDITLWMNNERAPSCQGLVEFIQSRWLPDSPYASEIGVACLKSAAFHFPGGPIDYSFHPLECLKDAGLKFTVTGVKKKAD